MFPPGDERNDPQHWLTNGTAKQKRRAHAVLGGGTKSDHDRAFRSKMQKKYRETGIVAIVGEKLGRRIDVELRAEVRLAVQLVQEGNERAERWDFKEEIESRLDKTISQATLTRYLTKSRENPPPKQQP